KIWLVVAALIITSASLFTINDAFAITSILWDSGNGGAHSVFDGAINMGTTVTFQVTDTNLAGNTVTDHINVLVNSTSYTERITLTIRERGNTVIFTN